MSQSPPPSRPSVVYIGPDQGCESVVQALTGIADVVHVTPDPSTLTAALQDAVGLIDASMRVPISDEMIAEASNLRIISCATTGSDHISRTELVRRGIPVHTLREDPELLRGLTPAAELSFALVLACARRIVPAARDVINGSWERERFPGMMLKGRRLGLVGCGRIGQWMARYARAFDMSVQGYDPYVTPWPEAIVRTSLEHVFSESDIISVHVHLSEDTRGIVSRQLIESSQPGVIIVNTSRGGILDEAALLDGLVAGRVGAAGLDVLDGEPDVDDHPLVNYARNHDNLIITPHCGGLSYDALRLVCHRAAEKVAAHLATCPT